MEPRESQMSEAEVFVNELNAGPREGAPATVAFLQKRLSALRYDKAGLQAENAALRAELDNANRLLQDVYASWNWWLAHWPRRALKALLRRARLRLLGAAPAKEGS
jgi:hypothetical protein